MIDLSQPQRGTLGEGCWFSDLFFAALEQQWTGGMLLETALGVQALFFENGDPVHATGVGFEDHYLGQCVVELELAEQEVVVKALRAHEDLSEEHRPLFGQWLHSELGLKQEDVERAVRLQCRARFSSCFRSAEIGFQAAPGKSASIEQVSLRSEGWPILFHGLTHNGSEPELRATADRLLGKAAKLKGSQTQLEALATPEAALKQGLKYLAKPRKPDQLERALGRRRARGTLRLLERLELLETLPASRAIPIAKTSPARVLSAQFPQPPKQAEPEPQAPMPPPKPPPTPPEVKELEQLYEKLSTLSHFELLGTKEKDDAPQIRGRYTSLAKKVHPDAFRALQVEESLLEKARAVSAQVNEAYQVLSNPESRAQYIQHLEKGRSSAEHQRQDVIKNAALQVKMALVHIKRKDFVQARKLLENAVSADPKEKIYGAHLAWTMFADSSYDKKEALKTGLPMLQQALGSNSQDPIIHFYLGRVYKEQGEQEKALRHFKAAEKIDPKFSDAVREIRLLSSRIKKQENTSKGIDVRETLSKWFKGK